MSTQVFNLNKTAEQYAERGPLFMGDEPGLFDTVNKHYPELWKIYKTMKSLDWDENEFNYSICNLEFKTCAPSIREMMIMTLAWQWEADSMASRAVAPLLAPFITDSSLWAAVQRISDNEVVHAATYSEIVRLSFDDPQQVFKDVLAVKESLERMDTVKNVFDELKEVGAKYTLGLITKEEAYPTIFKTFVALLVLERMQFMASFAITFTICSSNLFQPIGKAVQKIAQDELEVHAQFDKEVLRTELATPRGRETYESLKPFIKTIIDEVVNTEFAWTDHVFSGRELLGTNAAKVKSWVLFNARDVYEFLDIESEHKLPKTNPMAHLEDWLNISKTQAAPQEQDNNQYKVNVIVRDDETANFDVDF